MEKGTPPQEEDAPVQSGEPRLGLQRKWLARLLGTEREGGRSGENGAGMWASSSKNTEISHSKFLCTS